MVNTDLTVGEAEAWAIMGGVLVLNICWLLLNLTRAALGLRLQALRRVLSRQMLFIFGFAMYLELIPFIRIYDTAFVCGEACKRLAYYRSCRAVFIGGLLNLTLLLIDRIIASSYPDHGQNAP
jgi:hypothetical protein